MNNPKASELLIAELQPFTTYQVKISAKNRFGLSSMSEVIVATTYEGVPLAPQNIVAVSDEKEPLIHVTWDELDLQSANGIVTGYMVN